MSLDPTTIPPTTMPPTAISEQPAPTDPTDPTATTTYSDTYDPIIPPMPPSPKAEPFHPAPAVPATAPTPRERAYTLHLQGYRSPAIAAHLGVPERTIRSWIQQINQDLNALPALDSFDTLADADADQHDPHATVSTDPTQPTPALPLTTLQHQRTLAIERHRARAAAAWTLHDQLSASLTPLLARVSERLLLHTQYPDDADPVSLSTLQLAGGPVAPAFRAMYQLLPSLIAGLTRTLALAERADLQVDRLQGTIPPATRPATQPATPASTTKAEEKPWPTRDEINRAVQARRDAEDDAYIASLTPRQRHLLRLYASMPATLPDGPLDTWDIKIDPNVDIRGLRFPLPHIHHHDDDEDPDPTPPAHRPTGKLTGKSSGNKIGNASGNPGNATVTHPSPTSPNSSSRRRTSWRSAAKPSGAVLTAGSLPGNQNPKIGNDSGNIGNISGNDSGKRNSPHTKKPLPDAERG